MVVYNRIKLPGDTVGRKLTLPTIEDPSSPPPTDTRNALDAPYLTTSHVNQPIGSGATRAASGLLTPTGGGGKLKVDPILLSTGTGTNKRLIGINYFYNNTPSTGTKHTINSAPSIPANVTVMATDAMTHNGYMNGLFAAPETTPGKTPGRYIQGGQALYRPTAADDLRIAYWGIRSVDIYGDGRPASVTNGGHQGHGGSGLPTFGMTLRASEFQGTTSPQHVLALNINGKYLSNKDSSGGTTGNDRGWKEPANTADGGFQNQFLTDGVTPNPNYYGGSKVYMRMGTLLALPVDYDFVANGITNVDALLLGWTLKYFGIRIVDVTGKVDTFAISAQSTIEQTIANKPTAFHSQMIKMIIDCEAITNDGLGQWGGPGTRLTTAPPELVIPS